MESSFYERIRLSRMAQGLPPTVQDPDVLARVRSIIHFNNPDSERPAPNGPGGEPTMRTDGDSGLMTPEAAATYLGISARHVRQLAREQSIPSYVLGHRTVRFRRGDLDVWLAGRRR